MENIKWIKNWLLPIGPGGPFSPLSPIPGSPLSPLPPFSPGLTRREYHAHGFLQFCTFLSQRFLLTKCVALYLEVPSVPLILLRHLVLAYRVLQGGQAVQCCHLCLKGPVGLDDPLCSSRGPAAFEPWSKPFWLGGRREWFQSHSSPVTSLVEVHITLKPPSHHPVVSPAPPGWASSFAPVTLTLPETTAIDNSQNYPWQNVHRVTTTFKDTSYPLSRKTRVSSRSLLPRRSHFSRRARHTHHPRMALSAWSSRVSWHTWLSWVSFISLFTRVSLDRRYQCL